MVIYIKIQLFAAEMQWDSQNFTQEHNGCQLIGKHIIFVYSVTMRLWSMSVSGVQHPMISMLFIPYRILEYPLS